MHLRQNKWPHLVVTILRSPYWVHGSKQRLQVKAFLLKVTVSGENEFSPFPLVIVICGWRPRAVSSVEVLLLVLDDEVVEWNWALVILAVVVVDDGRKWVEVIEGVIDDKTIEDEGAVEEGMIDWIGFEEGEREDESFDEDPLEDDESFETWEFGLFVKEGIEEADEEEAKFFCFLLSLKEWLWLSEEEEEVEVDCLEVGRGWKRIDESWKSSESADDDDCDNKSILEEGREEQEVDNDVLLLLLPLIIDDLMGDGAGGGISAFLLLWPLEGVVLVWGGEGMICFEGVVGGFGMNAEDDLDVVIEEEEEEEADGISDGWCELDGVETDAEEDASSRSNSLASI